MNFKIRKMFLTLAIGIMIMASITGCSSPKENGSTDGSQNEQKKYVTFAANPSSSAFYPYWVAVGKAVQETYPEFQVTVSESQGAVDIVNRIRSGESILGNSISTTDFENYTGTGAFEGNADNTARVLWYYAVSPMYICTSQDSGITNVSDLAGQKFNLGGTGTSGAVLANDIFNLLGIKVDSFESSQSDAADAYASRQIKGTIKFGSVSGDSYVMQLNAALPINIVSFTDEQLEKITTAFPYLKEITIPAGTYEGIDYEVKTVAFYQGAASTTKLTQEEGYKIIKSVYDDGKAIIDAGFPTGANNDILEMALISSIPLHAGTVQYMVEKGMEVPKELIPAEYVAK